MFNKITLTILVITMMFTIGLVGYLFHVRGEFEAYLLESYPEASFDVGFSSIGYAFPYANDIYIYANCRTEKVNFRIVKNDGKIKERYLSIRNRHILNETVGSYFIGTEAEGFIDSVTTGVQKEERLNTKKIPDVKEIATSVHVYYKNNVFENNQGFAKASYDIANILKAKGLQLETLDFVEERNRGVYVLRLSEPDINGSREQFKGMVRKLK